jgi:hypothetical protein
LGTWGKGWVIDANALRTTNKSKKSNTPHHPQKKKNLSTLGACQLTSFAGKNSYAYQRYSPFFA